MSRRGRPVTSDEHALFRSMVDGKEQKPGVQPDAVIPEPKVRLSRPPLRPSGVDGGTDVRLRKGLIEPDAKIDLHGLTESAAHLALVRFVRDSVARGARLILVVTGKGTERTTTEPSELKFDRRPRGILKRMAPRWLQEPDLVRLVADIRTAHRRHGGAGALYVYLRKRTDKS